MSNQATLEKERRFIQLFKEAGLGLDEKGSVVPADSRVVTKKSENGYRSFSIKDPDSTAKQGKRLRIAAHRLMWQLHHGAIESPAARVSFLNGKRNDLRIENLVLRTDNRLVAPESFKASERRVFTDEALLSLRAKYVASGGGVGLTALAKQLGIGVTTLYRALTGDTYSHLNNGVLEARVKDILTSKMSSTSRRT